MATYHLYYLKGGLLVGSEDTEAASDNEAARIAEDKGRGDIVEVWDTESRVRIVRTGGARLETARRQAPCETQVAPGMG
jgi:hypothetical protein